MSAPVAERVQTLPSETLPGETLAVNEDRLYTSEELLQMSSDTTRVYELKKGILTIMSPAGGSHGRLAMNIGSQLHRFVEERELGVVFAAETGFKLEADPDTVLAPDACFVAWERIPDGEIPDTYFPGSPDIAVEVVSPGDRASDVQEKVQDWLSSDVALVWIVEPKSRTVTVYRADGSATVLHESAILDGEDVLPGFQYDLKSLFR